MLCHFNKRRSRQRSLDSTISWQLRTEIHKIAVLHLRDQNDHQDSHLDQNAEETAEREERQNWLKRSQYGIKVKMINITDAMTICWASKITNKKRLINNSSIRRWRNWSLRSWGRRHPWIRRGSWRYMRNNMSKIWNSGDNTLGTSIIWVMCIITMIRMKSRIRNCRILLSSWFVSISMANHDSKIDWIWNWMDKTKRDLKLIWNTLSNGSVKMNNAWDRNSNTSMVRYWMMKIWFKIREGENWSSWKRNHCSHRRLRVSSQWEMLMQPLARTTLKTQKSQLSKEATQSRNNWRKLRKKAMFWWSTNVHKANSKRNITSTNTMKRTSVPRPK